MRQEASLNTAVSERERLGRGSATVERLNRAGGRDGFEEVAALPDIDRNGRPTEAGTVQRVIMAPLDRLWKSGYITQREYDAGDRYRADAYLAAIDPGALSIDWNRTSGGSSAKVPSMFNSQHIATARIRMRSIDQKIPRHSIVSAALFLGLVKEKAFSELGQLLFGVRDAESASVAGRAGFRVALAALADCRG